jgi:hypothetical protein
MAVRLELVDETVSGEVLHALAVVLDTAAPTARSIIELRVRDEVEAHNRALASQVPPPERVSLGADAFALNGARRPPQRQRRPADAEVEVARAFEAFERNGFVMLVGDRQIESLDEPLPAAEALRVAFVRLVPLVGG